MDAKWLTLVILVIDCKAFDNNQTQPISDVLDHLLDGYNKEVRPGIGGDRVVVDTQILIKSMGPISENDMSYSMQVYFRQRWKDARLSYYLPNMTQITLSNKFIDNIWKPNSYFINGRNSKQHNITVPNAFIRLSHDGSIYMSVRLTVNARCPMMLSRYPMDRAVCPLYIGSFGYTTDELVYQWGNEVEIDPGVTLSQYELGNVRQQNSSQMIMNGEFSVLEVYIHLSRAVGFYVLQTYVPCYLIVSLSWVSFWINRDAAPARVLLGVTTILSTAAIGMTVREGLPRVPYATALDVYLNVCVVYEMAALIEYAAVNYFTKLMPKEGGSDEEEDDATDNTLITNTTIVQGADLKSLPEEEALLNTTVHQQMNSSRTKHKVVNGAMPAPMGVVGCLHAFWRCIVGSSEYRMQHLVAQDGDIDDNVSSIDIVARLLFPLSFGLFNLCYWLLYIYLEVKMEEIKVT